MERDSPLARVEKAEGAYLEALRNQNVAAQTSIEATRARENAERTCIERARELEAVYKVELTVEQTETRKALRAHAIATMKGGRDRDGYLEAIWRLVLSANMRLEKQDLRKIQVEYLRVFAPSDVFHAIQEVRRKNSRQAWRVLMGKVNILLQCRLLRKELDESTPFPSTKKAGKAASAEMQTHQELQAQQEEEEEEEDEEESDEELEDEKPERPEKSAPKKRNRELEQERDAAEESKGEPVRKNLVSAPSAPKSLEGLTERQQVTCLEALRKYFISNESLLLRLLGGVGQVPPSRLLAPGAIWPNGALVGGVDVFFHFQGDEVKYVLNEKTQVIVVVVPVPPPIKTILKEVGESAGIEEGLWGELLAQLVFRQYGQEWHCDQDGIQHLWTFPLMPGEKGGYLKYKGQNDKEVLLEGAYSWGGASQVSHCAAAGTNGRFAFVIRKYGGGFPGEKFDPADMHLTVRLNTNAELSKSLRDALRELPVTQQSITNIKAGEEFCKQVLETFSRMKNVIYTPGFLPKHPLVPYDKLQQLYGGPSADTEIQDGAILLGVNNWAVCSFLGVHNVQGCYHGHIAHGLMSIRPSNAVKVTNKCSHDDKELIAQNVFCFVCSTYFFCIPPKEDNLKKWIQDAKDKKTKCFLFVPLTDGLLCKRVDVESLQLLKTGLKFKTGNVE